MDSYLAVGRAIVVIGLLQLILYLPLTFLVTGGDGIGQSPHLFRHLDEGQAGNLVHQRRIRELHRDGILPLARSHHIHTLPADSVYIRPAYGQIGRIHLQSLPGTAVECFM